MEIGISYSKLMDMEVLSKGDPRKIAEYTVAKKRYEDMVTEFFNEEDGVLFKSNPSLEYVLELEQRAVNGTDRDKARAIIIRDRYEANEKKKVQHIDFRTARNKLEEKLRVGSEITEQDIDEMYRITRHFPTPDSMVLYSKIKRAFEQPGQSNRTQRQEKEEVVATPVMVQEAWNKAKQTGRMSDHVAYALLKQKLTKQESRESVE